MPSNPPPSTRDVPQPIFPPEDERNLWTALGRGLRCRCPRCGDGRLLVDYLSVRSSCEVCEERLDGHRADDLPPYLTIFLTGKILVPLYVFSEGVVDLGTTAQTVLWSLLALFLAAFLLPRIKGAVVAQQWATRAFGYGEQSDREGTGVEGATR
ncbi:MAG: DUF983 domain-containing protein [Pseudomonadota bacterium]